MLPKSDYTEMEAKGRAKVAELLYKRKMNHYYCERCDSWHIGHIGGNKMEVKEKKIVIDDKQVGKLCSKGKSIWRQRKEVRIKSDELSKIEGTLLGANTELAEKVQQKLQLED